MVKVTADWKMGDHSVGGLGNCFRGGDRPLEWHGRSACYDCLRYRGDLGWDEDHKESSDVKR